jgi:transcriptional regulator with XRE-family HTH domain
MADLQTKDTIPAATRIRCARQLRELSRTALARKVGVTPQKIADWEDVEYRSGPSPTVDQVLKIAVATWFPVEFFYDDELEEVHISFHRKREYR